jgi:hypothetical protein
VHSSASASAAAAPLPPPPPPPSAPVSAGQMPVARALRRAALRARGEFQELAA